MKNGYGVYAWADGTRSAGARAPGGGWGLGVGYWGGV